MQGIGRSGIFVGRMAVTDAVGHIVKQTSEQPPKYLVKLLFSFRGVTESTRARPDQEAVMTNPAPNDDLYL